MRLLDPDFPLVASRRNFLQVLSFAATLLDQWMRDVL
jgi:hypothetical protein